MQASSDIDGVDSCVSRIYRRLANLSNRLGTRNQDMGSFRRTDSCKTPDERKNELRFNL